MIIYGTRGVTKRLSGGNFGCPACGVERAYALKSVRRYFTLYFIPLIPVSEPDKYVECGSCGGTYAEAVLTATFSVEREPAVVDTPSQEQAPVTADLKCRSCGAPISLDADECGHCHSPTPAAVQRRQAQREREAAQAAQREAAERAKEANAEEEIKKTGTHAFVWSLVGLLVCCFPIAIVGVVKALKARKLAAARNVPAPGMATVALVLSALALLIFAAGVVAFILDQNALSDRREALTIVAEAASEENLSPETACALAELRVLTDGHDGTAPISIKNFECNGKVVRSDAGASIDGIRFNGTKKTHYDMRACLEYGSRWYVQSLIPNTETCFPEPEVETEPDPTPVVEEPPPPVKKPVKRKKRSRK